MVDMSQTIIANSDQLNADDLIGGDMVITISDVKQNNSKDQPIKIFHDKGQPWMPCKSMRRVLVDCWGVDGQAYIGRQVHLHRDQSVKWAGQEVGGIRIKALSHIKGKRRLALTATRGVKREYIVDELKAVPSLQDLAREAAKYGLASYKEWYDQLKPAQQKHLQETIHKELKQIALKADEA